MYGRDPGRTRFVPNADLPRDGVSISWERSVGASSWRPPVVANGTVFCQYANGLFVVDVETGTGTLSDTHGGFGRGTGPMAFGSTRLYEDGVLIVPYGNEVAGYAADPNGWPDTVSGRGQQRARWWITAESISTGPSLLSSSSAKWLAAPVVVDGTVVSLHPEGTVSAVATDDGSGHWRYGLTDANNYNEYGVVPIGHVVDTATGTVVVKGRVAGHSLLAGLGLADGSLEWTVDNGLERRRAVAARNSLTASDGTIYTVDWTNPRDTLQLLALDATTGARRWRKPLERNTHIGIAVDETTVYHTGAIRADEGSDPLVVVAFDRDDGSVRWETNLGDMLGGYWTKHLPPPTVAGTQLLVPVDQGLTALATADGERLWTFTETVGTAGGGETERTGLTPAVVSDNRIVIGTTLMLYGLE